MLLVIQIVSTKKIQIYLQYSNKSYLVTCLKINIKMHKDAYISTENGKKSTNILNKEEIFKFL